MAEENAKKEINDLNKKLEQTQKDNETLKAQLDESKAKLTQIEKQQAETAQNQGKVKVMDYLDKNNVPFSKWNGILTFLKVKKGEYLDEKYLEEKLANYAKRRGGGV